MRSRDFEQSLRLGSLCTGYGGLDMAVQQVLDVELSWVADNDRHVRQLLAERHPHVPNLGDISSLDWTAVEPVDVLTAGFPCQDISYAGRGAGIAHCVGDA
jgi:DNA (cytosine-5)-methyltransferase 1